MSTLTLEKSSPTLIAKQLMDVAKELTSLLVLEQKMIFSQNISGTLDFAARKQALIDAYQSGMSALESDAGGLASMDRDVKINLKATLSVMQKTMQATLDTVEAARNARVFILESIREAMIADQKSPTYAAQSSRRPAANYGSGNALSVSFNQTL